MGTRSLLETKAILFGDRVNFTEERFMSNGFHGTRLVFADLRTTRKAEKVLGEVIPSYHDKFAISFF